MEILVKVNNKDSGKKSLLELLREKKFFLNSDCGGKKSKCGKCKIKVTNLKLQITDEDIFHLSKKELENGYRLACKIYPKKDISVILEESGKFDIISNFLEKKHTGNQVFKKGYGVAVDIGTTTIVMRIYNMLNGNFIDEEKILNPQVIYGSDVITRISNSKDHFHHMQKQILESLNFLFKDLISNNNISESEFFSFIISGNTTMIHILKGFSIQSLGVFPFTPITLEYRIEDIKNIFPDLFYGEIKIIPGISSFVGGDIVSGIYYTEMYNNEKVSILLDLGTNGEIAIGNKDKIIVTSTAAGPAFEGGNIQCGIGSIGGAICSAKYIEGNFIFKTIDELPIKGICGTGLMDIISIFSSEKFIDETGLFNENNKNRISLIKDKIFITQKDIREFQLAKSAIRTGIEIAIESFNINKDDIDTLYLSGGFGAKVDLNSFFNLGIIPKELESKVIIAGNTSLAGAIQSIYDADYESEITKIKNNSFELNLAENENFNNYFADFMYF